MYNVKIRDYRIRGIGVADRSCAAIVDGGTILMVLQTYKGETFWTFPGGRIEPLETRVQCAIRETKEETGLDIEISGKVCEVFNARINGTYHCFLGTIVGGTEALGSDPELSMDIQELADLQWFSMNELADHPEVKRVLEYVKR